MEPLDVGTAERKTARRSKRLLGALCLLLLAAAVLLAWPLALAPFQNDRAAARLQRELTEGLELRPGEVLVETASFAGNTSGTGNHVELWAGALIHCTGPAETAGGTALDRARSWEWPWPAAADWKTMFPTLAGLEDWSGYYILDTYGDAAAQWDLRGH